jgi:hypothetical protein
MFNQGIEVSIDGMIVKTKDFSWNINVNASTIKMRSLRCTQKKLLVVLKICSREFNLRLLVKKLCWCRPQMDMLYL